jgi:hypothetical protein
MASPEHAHRVRGRRPVEGSRHRRAPIDEQRIVILIEEPDTADVRPRPSMVSIRPKHNPRSTVIN